MSGGMAVVVVFGMFFLLVLLLGGMILSAYKKSGMEADRKPVVLSSSAVELRRVLGLLEEAYEVAKKKIEEEMTDFGYTDPLLMKDAVGRFILLDALLEIGRIHVLLVTNEMGG